MTKKDEPKMTTQGKIIAGVIAIIAIFLLVTIFSAPNNRGGTGQITDVNMIELMDEDAILGDPNAPITIIEFSDYECPFCAKFHATTYQQLKQKYIDTGVAKLIYRDFPLGFHANAQKAAEAAECAGEQDRYYEMHDTLFTRGVGGGVDSFKQYAEDLGLDTEAFNECLDSGQMQLEVSRDAIDGAQVGVSGTPAFFVNGVFIGGAQPITAFDEIINQALQN